MDAALNMLLILVIAIFNLSCNGGVVDKKAHFPSEGLGKVFLVDPGKVEIELTKKEVSNLLVDLNGATQKRNTYKQKIKFILRLAYDSGDVYVNIIDDTKYIVDKELYVKDGANLAGNLSGADKRKSAILTSRSHSLSPSPPTNSATNSDEEKHAPTNSDER